MNQTWQPIDTAPKDGRLILIRQDYWAPVHARWTREGWRVTEYEGPAKPTRWAEVGRGASEGTR